MPGISSECDKGCSKRSCKAFCRLHHQADYECYPISHGTITLLSDIEKNTLQRITIAGSCANNPVLAFRRFEHSSGLRLFLELVHTSSASLPLPILFQQHPEHAVFSVKAVSLAVVTFYRGVVGENGDISKESSVNLVRLEA